MLSSEAARLQIHSYKVAAAQGGLLHTRASPLPAPTRRWGQHGRHRGHGGGLSVPPARAPAGRWPMHHSARVTARQGTARRDAQLRVAAGTGSSFSRSCGLSIAPVARGVPAQQAGPFGTAPRARPPLWMLTPDTVNRHRKRHFPCQLHRMVPYPPQPCWEHPQPARLLQAQSSALAGLLRASRFRARMAPAVCTSERVQVLAARTRVCSSPPSLIRAINII